MRYPLRPYALVACAALLATAALHAQSFTTTNGSISIQ